jgi:hypothetical protein
MVDNPDTPDAVLDFGVPIELFYSTDVYSNNNLFNNYYKQFIQDISDKDSKIVTGWFALTPKDILILDFRNEFFVNGYFYRLNKIYDYNSVAETLTKVEFIKIKFASPFIKQRITGLAPDIGFEGGVNVPIPRPNRQAPDINGNVIDATVVGGIIVGTDNVVGAGAMNPTILGSSGIIVAPGVTRAVVIGSTDRTISTDGAVIVGNVDYTPKSGMANDGTYTPTLFNTTNVIGSLSHSCCYIRTGSIVTVSGLVDVNCTVGLVATVLGLSLPFASTINASEQCAGSGGLYGTTEVATILGDNVNNRATLSFTPLFAGTKKIYFIFQYQII